MGAKRDYIGVALSETGQEQFKALMEEKAHARDIGNRLIGFIG